MSLANAATITDQRFSSLGTPRRVWAISAIHSDIDRLTDLHDQLIARVRPGDRLVYLGNYTGYGTHACETIDELLTFRRLFLSVPGMMPHDITYLRGGQEEMWEKLLQLHFAPNPSHVLLWMLGNGMANTLAAYGLSQHDGICAASEGIMSLIKWTDKIRRAMRSRPGHEIFSHQLRRAAYTGEQNPARILFVNAGLDPARPLQEQEDAFWWAGKRFGHIESPYEPFHKVIRGYDPDHRGMHLNCVTATIDGGCGFGGSLICAGLDGDGTFFEVLEA